MLTVFNNNEISGGYLPVMLIEYTIRIIKKIVELKTFTLKTLANSNYLIT